MVKNRFKLVLLLLVSFHLKYTRAGGYFKSDRLLFDFYSSKWVNTSNDLTTDPTVSCSISYGKDISIKSSNFSWFYGLGYDFNTIHHLINFNSLPSINETPRELGIRILNVPYSINKLSSQYLEVPLEFRYRTQTKHPLRIYYGVKVGYMVRSSYVFQKDRKDIYHKKNLNELNHYKYGMTFRLGYGIINIYAYYGLNGLLSAQSQLAINQLSFGITLIAN